MTLAQAILAATSIRVHATDIIDLEINKKQAHYLRKTHGPWVHTDDDESEGYAEAIKWSLNDGRLLFFFPA